MMCLLLFLVSLLSAANIFFGEQKTNTGTKVHKNGKKDILQGEKG
jgi:hypothetical protein